MKRILMIAFHFPPLSGSSGIQRTLRFVQHLPAFGWQAQVLSIDPRAYEKTSDDLLADVPADVVVRRAFGLDTARQLSIGGRYLGWMARPDRWTSWRFDGVRQGMKMIREQRPDVIWSTYPIATAHLIGMTLQQRTGIPWIADFRDPMAQDGYPADPATWQSFKHIEVAAATRASVLTFTTPGAVREYRDRYPHAADRMHLLENGYDESSFAGTEGTAPVEPLIPGTITLLHSGIVYPAERDPGPLFEALGRLRKAGTIGPNNVRVRFRAPVHDELLHRLAERHGVTDQIEVAPPIPYRQALAEMLRADGLLVLQASNCNDQIPAKIYEYLRAGRPILGLTDPRGDTASVLMKAGLNTIARLDSAHAIEASLPRFIEHIRRGSAPLPSPQAVADASRQGRTAALVQHLNLISRP